MGQSLIDRYRRWFEYEIDSHAKTLESLRNVPAELQQSEGFRKALNLLAHLIAARMMWLHRFGVSDKPANLFPKEASLSELPQHLDEMHNAWRAYLDQLNEEELARVFEYQSYEGGHFRSSIEDILTQLSGHSWYHRGQIAQLIRAMGAEPAVTDFVYWSREPIGK